MLERLPAILVLFYCTLPGHHWAFASFCGFLAGAVFYEGVVEYGKSKKRKRKADHAAGTDR
jgi:hypothetical protein